MSTMDFSTNKVVLYFLELNDECLSNILLGITLGVIVIVLAVVWLFLERSKIVRNAYTLRKYVQVNNTISSIKIIEKYPATINVQFNSDGYTPFLEACKRGNLFLVKVMLKYGANLRINTNRGETAFYLACYNLIETSELKDASIIHALYHAGANINSKTKFGYTPLHLASVFGHVPLADWLIMKNADFKVKPYPHLLAHSFGHKEVSELLKKLIAQRENMEF